MCFSQREALTYQFYSLGESPWLVSVTPSVELNITAGERSTQECQSVFCCAFFVCSRIIVRMRLSATLLRMRVVPR